jgi:hypothetical protein
MRQISLEKLQNFTADFLKNAKNQVKSMSFCVVFHNGQNIREKLIKQVIADYQKHPSERALKYIAAKAPLSVHSGITGVSCAHIKAMFGLSTKADYHALLAINTSEIKRSKDLEMLLLKAVSHALDIADKYETKFNAKSATYFPIIAKENPLNRAHINLKSDIFAAIVRYFSGEKDAIENIAKERSARALEPKTRFAPEEYPFLMAIETLKYTLDDLESKPGAGQIYAKARDISKKVMTTFEISQIHQWWNFAKSAQDMAWRGHKAEDIISFAINTSDDPYIRATGLLMADVLGIEPNADLDLYNQHNTFATHEQNARAHKKAIDELFEKIVDEAVRKDDSRPIYDAANSQNLKLTEGKVLGWCAHALQAAGKRFDHQRKEGIQAIDLIRDEFVEQIEDSLWDTLNEFSEEVIKSTRKDGMLSTDDVIGIAQANPHFTVLLNSIMATLNDPGYIAKLEAANDMAPKGPTPAAGPSFAKTGPQNQPNLGPKTQPSFAPSLGLGGGGGSRSTHKKRPLPKKESAEDLDKKEDQ